MFTPIQQALRNHFGVYGHHVNILGRLLGRVWWLLVIVLVAPVRACLTIGMQPLRGLLVRLPCVSDSHAALRRDVPMQMPCNKVGITSSNILRDDPTAFLSSVLRAPKKQA
jgi:hypothetical protein